MSEVLRLLPQEFWLGSTKVSSNRQLLEIWLLEFEVSDDHSRSEIEVSEDDVLEIFISVSFGGCSVGENVEGDWESETNTVSDLDEGSLAETVVNEGLGDPSGGISSRSVDLSTVFTRESTT